MVRSLARGATRAARPNRASVRVRSASRWVKHVDAQIEGDRRVREVARRHELGQWGASDHPVQGLLDELDPGLGPNHDLLAQLVLTIIKA
jgi:hypothetical protein